MLLDVSRDPYHLGPEAATEFAELLQTYLGENYPRLSRGVYVKDNPTNQSTYNQDLLGNSVLVEIGGYENTLEEEYRTVYVLSKTIKDVLSDWEDQQK